MIENAGLDANAVAASLDRLVSDLGVVDNKSLLVAGTKTLHHLLPDLVPPMDRRWTGAFFGWWPIDPQNRQTAILSEAYGWFVEIAQAVKCTAARRSRLEDLDHEAARQRCRRLLLAQRHQAEGLTSALSNTIRVSG